MIQSNISRKLYISADTKIDKLKFVIVLFLIISFSAYSQTLKWKLLDDNTEYKLFVRAHSSDAAWYKTEYKKIRIEKTLFGIEKKIKTELTLYKFDCKTKMIGTLSEVIYDEEGKVIDSNDYGKYPKMEHVIPDSLVERMLLNFCK